VEKTVVTGGGGFIGSHAAEHFSRDSQVIVCDNLSRFQAHIDASGSSSYNWYFLKRRHPKIRLLNIDMRDSQAVEEATKGAHTIIHAAGQVAVTHSLVDPRADFEANALGTFNILEAARLNDSELIFCSTNKVYGENVNSIPIREETTRYALDDLRHSHGIAEDLSIDRTGHSPYGSSKLAADVYVQDYAHTYGLRTAVFRMSCIYGERQFGVEDQGWLAWFVIATLTGKPITIYGNGKQVRDVLYVKDLIDAFDRFLLSNIRHAVFNMGGGPNNTLSLLELLDLLRTITGKHPKVFFSDWRASDQKVYVSDIRKVRHALGWSPVVPPQEGILRVINWVKENMHAFTEKPIGRPPTPLPSSPVSP
jgi:CDP-paratose 2-epimerase